MKRGDLQKVLVAEIRLILINDWDPIGVGTNPNLFDEYDAYIGRIISMLFKECSLVELVSFLQTIEDKEVECTTDSITRCRVAKKLQDCYLRILDRCMI